MWIVDRSKVLMKDCYEALATFPKIGFWQIFRGVVLATIPKEKRIVIIVKAPTYWFTSSKAPTYWHSKY